MYDFTVMMLVHSCRQFIRLNCQTKIKPLETVPYELKAMGMYF